MSMDPRPYLDPLRPYLNLRVRVLIVWTLWVRVRCAGVALKAIGKGKGKGLFLSYPDPTHIDPPKILHRTFIFF